MSASSSVAACAVRVTTCPLTFTWPALIAAAARARLSKKPRVTNKISRRVLAVIDGFTSGAFGQCRLRCPLAHELANASENLFGVQTSLVIHIGRRVMVNIAVGQHHGTEFQTIVQMARIGQKMRHMRSKAADCTFFDRENASCSPAIRAISSPSSGFMKRASTTLVRQPSASSLSAACTACSSRVP